MRKKKGPCSYNRIKKGDRIEIGPVGCYAKNGRGGEWKKCDRFEYDGTEVVEK